jgi:hypothetical protein
MAAIFVLGLVAGIGATVLVQRATRRLRRKVRRVLRKAGL